MLCQNDIHKLQGRRILPNIESIHIHNKIVIEICDCCKVKYIDLYAS